MGWLARTLFWIAALGTASSTVYSGMVVVGAVRFGRRKRREDAAGAVYLPPISVLKPLHGTEPGLEENLQRFFEQDYPQFELLFCARHETDAGLLLARSVATRYPAVVTRFLSCGEPQFPNAKMWSLAALAQAASFETLVTSDADARVAPDYLQRCVQALADPAVDLASCLYLGQTEGGLAARLDALGKSVEMSGGILVAEMVERGVHFALGVTMILRREAFTLAGGYSDLGQYYAEDFVLGNRLADHRPGSVRMSNHVIRLMVLPQHFRESFRDQVRWMKSTRRSRPAGHLGTGLTFAVPFGVLALAWGLVSGNIGAGLLWLLWTAASRSGMAACVLWALGDPQPLRSVPLYGVRDLLGGVVWVASYVGSTMHYHGGAYELGPGGRFRRLDQLPDETQAAQPDRAGPHRTTPS